MYKIPRKYRLFFQIACLLFVVNDARAQTPDSTAVTLPDSLPQRARRILPLWICRDIRIRAMMGWMPKWRTGAKDSMWFDVLKKQVHLYGGASVKYTTLDIKAGYILLDYAKNEISAEQLRDTSGQLAGLPAFNDGEQSFTATRLRYNFKSRKGIIYEARTQQEDMYVLGSKAKFIGSTSTDTTQKSKNIIYNQDAILTTCDAPHPHFGIRTRKLKVIPNKLVVTGFSNLELGGIPTPIVIPFGFFPLTKNRKAGLLIPKDFQGRREEGLGINDLGWYQPISEHADATVLFGLSPVAPLASSGTLRVQLQVQICRRFYPEFQ